MNIVNSSANIKSWREVLPIHPAALLLPRLPDAELTELGVDIATNGLHTPVIILFGEDESEQLLDGVNRLDAMEGAGIALVKDGAFNHDQVLHQYVRGNTDPYAFVLSVNLYRRHLTNAQKTELVGKLLELKPTASDRQIAAMTGTSHPTVAKVRREKEAGGKITTSPTRTDKRGREQPATKPSKAPTTSTVPAAPSASIAVGTRVDHLVATPVTDTVEAPGPNKPDALWQLIEAIDRVYELGQDDPVGATAEALTQTGRKKVQKCLRELAGILHTLRDEIAKSEKIMNAGENKLIGRKLTCSADVDAALKDWRRRPLAELPDLALAVRRAAGRGLHLSEKQWRAVHEIEAAAVIAGMQVA
jgi:hypothetical protein